MLHDLEEIQESIQFLSDWEDKYSYILELGDSLPGIPDTERRPEYLVEGCQSSVWLLTEYDSTDDILSLQMDSDAHIVRGLIAILLSVYSDQSPRDILSFGITEFFDELDLLKHLSPIRGNGLRALIQKIRSVASQYLS
ncbi:MAG: SufE family protein [Gammaproteobacteria bacterium]|nr:SufE family protein [Gammaproteobacteria bacterium]MYC24891.1 SufE family protein [Gammaproteobacteria bacterium]